MACNQCETTFQGAQSVVVSIQRSGTTGNLYVQNQGRNIVMIRRILFCYTTPTGYGVLYLRPPPDGIAWTYPTAFLEPGITALYYSLNIANVQTFQAQAEYIEIEGRSRSCAA
ncbi:MAG TPA: hypothetical protein VJT67_03190 [Longimicrobiaceae bacterium]|nr:hypothetical protein [Longimicrobiaceae bacterium]